MVVWKLLPCGYFPYFSRNTENGEIKWKSILPNSLPKFGLNSRERMPAFRLLVSLVKHG